MSDEDPNLLSVHEGFMRMALEQAAEALRLGEVPVGAVVVAGGTVVGAGFNEPIRTADATAHAEIVALRRAAAAFRNYRLPGAIVYVTVEPCLMCVGALVHARIATLVFGATEPKAGAVCSAMRMLEHPALNHRVAVVAGVLAEPCGRLIQQFFQSRR